MYNIPSARRKKKKYTPLNLIPILDVVFILVFFLLASSQILRIFEIGSDLPIFRLATNPPLQKDDFDLKVIINPQKITLQNTKKKRLIDEIKIRNWEDKEFLNQLNMKIKEIKDSYPEEERVLVASHGKISYQNLVNILDNLRNFNLAETKEERGKLFKQIMFEE